MQRKKELGAHLDGAALRLDDERFSKTSEHAEGALSQDECHE